MDFGKGLLVVTGVVGNAKCAIVKACFRDPQIQRSYREQAEGYGFIISTFPPRNEK